MHEDHSAASMTAMWSLVQKYSVAIAWGLVERDYGTISHGDVGRCEHGVGRLDSAWTTHSMVTGSIRS